MPSYKVVLYDFHFFLKLDDVDDLDEEMQNPFFLQGDEDFDNHCNQVWIAVGAKASAI